MAFDVALTGLRNHYLSDGLTPAQATLQALVHSLLISVNVVYNTEDPAPGALAYADSLVQHIEWVQAQDDGYPDGEDASSPLPEYEVPGPGPDGPAEVTS
jgi:hypothetical protein